MLNVTMVDLVSLIEQKSGIRLTRKATTGNGEYWGMCPFCKDGTNRFHVWPASLRPHYWCRVCLASGDGVQFLKDYCALTFTDACMELGIGVDEGRTPYVPQIQRKDQPPCQKWQEAAMLIVERAERYLWHPNAPKAVQALAYLRDRGLTDETIRKARLGYIPLGKDGRWFFEEFEKWGLDPEDLTPEQLHKGGVRVPDGILIPWLDGSTIWKLAVKRPGESMDYGQVMGSGEGLYGIDSLSMDKPTVMVEGEFDALSVLQEAGDLVGCVATGSTTRGRLARWISELSLSSYVLQSYDDDAAGDEGASYWLNTLSNCIRWQPIYGNDANEMLQKLDKESFKNWILWGMYAWDNAQETPVLDTLARVEQYTEPIPAIEPLMPELEDEEDERLLEFAETVSDIVGVFGPNCQLSRLDISPKQYILSQRRYVPVSLETLPRKQCPHVIFSQNYKKMHCQGKPLAHGWCATHAKSQELLEFASKLNFPELKVSESYWIEQGIEQWEGYAESVSEAHLTRDIALLKRMLA